MKHSNAFTVGEKVSLVPVTRKSAIVGNITAVNQFQVVIGTSPNNFTCPWSLITSMVKSA